MLHISLVLFSLRMHCACFSKRQFADLKWSALHNSIFSSERDFVMKTACPCSGRAISITVPQIYSAHAVPANCLAADPEKAAEEI